MKKRCLPPFSPMGLHLLLSKPSSPAVKFCQSFGGRASSSSGTSKLLLYTSSLLSLWNLDFFPFIIPPFSKTPFCISLSVLAGRSHLPIQQFNNMCRISWVQIDGTEYSHGHIVVLTSELVPTFNSTEDITVFDVGIYYLVCGSSVFVKHHFVHVLPLPDSLVCSLFKKGTNYNFTAIPTQNDRCLHRCSSQPLVLTKACTASCMVSFGKDFLASSQVVGEVIDCKLQVTQDHFNDCNSAVCESYKMHLNTITARSLMILLTLWFNSPFMDVRWYSHDCSCCRDT